MMLKARFVLSTILLLTSGSSKAQPLAINSIPQIAQDSTSEDWRSGNLNELDGLTVRLIFFDGNKKTPHRVLMDALSFKPGDTFNYKLLKRSLKNLNGLGLLAKVSEQDVTWQVDRQIGLVDLTFKIREKPRR